MLVLKAHIALKKSDATLQASVGWSRTWGCKQARAGEVIALMAPRLLRAVERQEWGEPVLLTSRQHGLPVPDHEPLAAMLDKVWIARDMWSAWTIAFATAAEAGLRMPIGGTVDAAVAEYTDRPGLKGGDPPNLPFEVEFPRRVGALARRLRATEHMATGAEAAMSSWLEVYDPEREYGEGWQE
jgi:hypothetical protein